MIPTREAALELFLRHNRDEMHLRHARALEVVMRHFAPRYGGDVDLWGVVGLLHDLDWEETQHAPERHTADAIPLLRDEGYDEQIVRAMRSHSWGLLQDDVPPVTPMEKVLYAVDELTGFVSAVALVRPSRSLSDLEPKSVLKKWKDKAFARGVDREVISRGAELLNVPLEELISAVIEALRPVETELGLGTAR
ncbi:MAG TPA: HDIG domain-containing protein [Synergistaceae bacterium]|nr:HDIG domain-containing protein [Synergistaceae bacterium]HQF91637.1 HDIG domain-containing protein [Synergistaceae bacterium]HQH78423.1 HDIG domain-containing protein [Synergistaceae bacterium]HQK25670.1 HDIG domain-containing protein [Synergistaceae bacterium]